MSIVEDDLQGGEGIDHFVSVNIISIFIGFFLNMMIALLKQCPLFCSVIRIVIKSQLNM